MWVTEINILIADSIHQNEYDDLTKLKIIIKNQLNNEEINKNYNLRKNAINTNLKI